MENQWQDGIYPKRSGALSRSAEEKLLLQSTTEYDMLIQCSLILCQAVGEMINGFIFLSVTNTTDSQSVRASVSAEHLE